MVLAGVPGYCVGETNRLSCRFDELIRLVAGIGERDWYDFVMLVIAVLGLIVSLVGALGAAGAAGAAVWTSRDARRIATTAGRAEDARRLLEDQRRNEERWERYDVRVDDAVARAAESVGVFVEALILATTARGRENFGEAWVRVIGVRTAAYTQVDIWRMVARGGDVETPRFALRVLQRIGGAVVVDMDSDEAIRVGRALADLAAIFPTARDGARGRERARQKMNDLLSRFPQADRDA